MKLKTALKNLKDMAVAENNCYNEAVDSNNGLAELSMERWQTCERIIAFVEAVIGEVESDAKSDA